MDCLLVHTAQTLKAYTDIRLISVGTIGLASYLEKKGLKVKIFDTALYPDPERKLLYLISRESPRFVCFSLQWHKQSACVISCVGLVKEKFPWIKTLLGGCTASYFAEEILSGHESVDYIIRGDGEEPLRILAETKELTAENLRKVPNLFFRNGSGISSPLNLWTADRDVLDAADQTRLDLCCDTDLLFINGAEARQRRDDAEKHEDRIFCYSPGRGCVRNCSYCGGCLSFQKKIYGREFPCFESPSSAARKMIKAARKYGCAVHAGYCPLGFGDYFSELYGMMKGENIKIRFEHWGVPSSGFISRFREIFAPGSKIILTFNCAGRGLRAKNGFADFSNEDMLSSLENIRKAGIRAQIHFTAGLPFETPADTAATKMMMKRIKENTGFACEISYVEIEPGSPMFENPERYGIISGRHSFGDFLEASKKERRPGYRTAEMSEEDIIRIVAELEEFSREE